jgi:hypothetical protein
MGGGLMQLVAYGAQDVYLTGNPQITFFKVVYRRYTNFAIETVELTLNGTADFGKRVTVTITRNGDLVTRMYLRVELNPVVMNNVPQSDTDRNKFLFSWIRQVGNFLIDNIQFEIGGSQIDKHWGHWLSVWNDLTKDVNTQPAYNALVGDVPELTALRSPDSQGNFTQPYILFVPLIFWCNTNSGLALPLIALQYHEVRLWIETNPFQELICYSNNLTPARIGNGIGVMNDMSLLTDYVYIDTEERRRFAQVGHEYLINQLQFTGVEAVNNNPLRVKLGFNHPTKELIWTFKSGDYISGSSPFLCYSHLDDWSGAVEYAANNVITGSVTVADTSLIPVPTPATAPEVNISSVTYDNWNTVNPVGTNTKNTSKYSVFTYVAGQGVNDSKSPSDYAKELFTQLNGPNTDVSQVNFKFRRDVLVNPQTPSYNLGDYVTKWVVLIYYNVVNPDGTGKVGTLNYLVKAIEQNITVRDVSVPISSWTDNRYTAQTGNGGYADMDIWAILPLCTGLLINNRYNPVKTALIQLNGHDRFDMREGAYFNLIETYNYHSSTPSNGVNVFSFALHPEQHQPSGTCNLSRIDNTTLINWLWTDYPYADPSRNPPPLSIVGPSSECYIYDTNYNVLRIMSGMGGLAYSN